MGYLKNEHNPNYQSVLIMQALAGERPGTEPSLAEAAWYINPNLSLWAHSEDEERHGRLQGEAKPYYTGL